MNKNHRQLVQKMRVAKRKGESELMVQVPVFNYHSCSGSSLSWKTFPVTRGSGVVSKNTRRNTQERVLHNAGGGDNSSFTVHEAISKDRPMRFKSHQYLSGSYRQPHEKLP